MKIREMAEEDIPSLAKLNCDVFGEDTSEAQAARVFSNAFQKRVAGSCLVAEQDGELIGAIFGEKTVTFRPNSANIRSFFVKQGFREKGVGRNLLGKCLESLKKSGIESVSLTVVPENEGAISFYEKEGFGLFRLMYRKML